MNKNIMKGRRLRRSEGTDVHGGEHDDDGDRGNQHDHGGAIGIDGNVLGIGAHELGELLIDDLNDHLGRSQRFQNLGIHTPGGDQLGEVLADLVADVSLQQGQADLSHGLLNIFFLQTALASEFLEGVIDFFS